MCHCAIHFLFFFFKRVRERKTEVRTLEKVLRRSLGHTDLIEMSKKKKNTICTTRGKWHCGGLYLL